MKKIFNYTSVLLGGILFNKSIGYSVENINEKHRMDSRYSRRDYTNSTPSRKNDHQLRPSRSRDRIIYQELSELVDEMNRLSLDAQKNNIDIKNDEIDELNDEIDVLNKKFLNISLTSRRQEAVDQLRKKVKKANKNMQKELDVFTRRLQEETKKKKNFVDAITSPNQSIDVLKKLTNENEDFFLKNYDSLLQKSLKFPNTFNFLINFNSKEICKTLISFLLVHHKKLDFEQINIILNAIIPTDIDATKRMNILTKLKEDTEESIRQSKEIEEPIEKLIFIKNIVENKL
jgi:hypothetical protein